MERIAKQKKTLSKCCILLVRVSTEKQDYSPQLRELKKYAQSLGYSKFKEIATKESGFLNFEKKDGFKQVVEYISQNPDFNTIIIAEMSRLSRQKVVLEQIKIYLTINRIQLIIKDINFMLFDSEGKISLNTDVLFSLFASFAESEMKTKIERFGRTKKYLSAQGVSLSGKRLFGYDRKRLETGKNTYVINKKESECIKTLYDWYLNGINGDKTKCSVRKLTLECIAHNFPTYLHSTRNVNKTLKEEAYTGYKVTNNKRKNSAYWKFGDDNAPKYIACSTEMKYPQILDIDLFNAVQKKMENNNCVTDKSSKHTTLLSKLILCDCGHYYNGEYQIKDGFKRAKYLCKQAKQPVRRCFVNKGTFSMYMADSVIWSFCLQHIDKILEYKSREEAKINVDSLKDEIKNLKKEIKEIEKKIDIENIIFRKTGNSKEYEKRINDLDIEKSKLIVQIDKRNTIIDSIENKKEENLKREIVEHIEEIENRKDLLSLYIHKLITKIKVLYNSRLYIVFQVYYNIETNTDYSFSNYIVVKRSTRDDYKICYFQDELFSFEDEYFIFKFNNIRSKFHISDIFLEHNPEIVEMAKWMQNIYNLSFSFNSISQWDDEERLKFLEANKVKSLDELIGKNNLIKRDNIHIIEEKLSTLPIWITEIKMLKYRKLEIYNEDFKK